MALQSCCRTFSEFGYFFALEPVKPFEKVTQAIVVETYKK